MAQRKQCEDGNTLANLRRQSSTLKKIELTENLFSMRNGFHDYQNKFFADNTETMQIDRFG